MKKETKIVRAYNEAKEASQKAYKEYKAYCENVKKNFSGDERDLHYLLNSGDAFDKNRETFYEEFWLAELVEEAKILHEMKTQAEKQMNGTEIPAPEKQVDIELTPVSVQMLDDYDIVNHLYTAKDYEYICNRLSELED